MVVAFIIPGTCANCAWLLPVRRQHIIVERQVVELIARK